MNKQEKIRYQQDFFKRAGRNVKTFIQMICGLPDVGFYIKDKQGRIVALNRRNCEICNLKDEIDAIGKRSDQLFSKQLASAYMGDDKTVLETGKPLVNCLSAYPNDYSSNFEYKSVYPIKGKNGRIIGTTCLYRLVPNPEKVPSWHGLMKKITLYINEHYAEDISVTQMAKLIGTSTSKFTRAFIRTLSITPGKYITNIRLTAARQMLETTDKTLVEIAQETGFYDLSHFTRIFKSERKMTPGQYRRQYLSIGHSAQDSNESLHISCTQARRQSSVVGLPKD